MEAFQSLTLTKAFFGIGLLILGIVLAKVARHAIARVAADRFSAHQSLLLQRIAVYLVAGIFIFSALQQIGVNLGVLLGAAGILTVALGFASQTSASNIISGLFLLSEKPFAVGDVIKIGDMLGEVISVDLLSVKLRTFDNLFVRMPNETIIKSQVTTLTRFPIRRFDLKVGIAYKEDIKRATDILLKVADEFHLCLEDPKPIIILLGFAESSIDIQLSAWSTRENFLDFRNELTMRVKNAFDKHGVEIPFPHRTLYTGSATTPFPVSMRPEGNSNLAEADSKSG
ncbi:MAG: mechanosensitive ion channel family protein [Ketobacteraceae bacterium]|nr:mechanosensitive ion channel family protein [Ketobacteraceae bacterium]